MITVILCVVSNHLLLIQCVQFNITDTSFMDLSLNALINSDEFL